MAASVPDPATQSPRRAPQPGRAAASLTARALLAVWLLGAVGCANRTYLIATPHVALGEAGRARFEALPDALKTCEIDLLYAADRAVARRTLLGVEYGAARSGELVFGAAIVQPQPDLTWERFVELCTTDRRRGAKPWLQLKRVTQLGRLAISIDKMEVVDGRYVVPAEEMARLRASRDILHDELRRRLALTPHKDVYIYVHGFNNQFHDAVNTLGMLWHMAGRPGVPIAYTWPAGRGGLGGYAYDRESGEYTVFHLKLFLRDVAACPEVERVHLIGHSRGTDVVSTALRELNIAYKARGESTAEALKLANLVLAAPDLDAGVFRQRFAMEDLHLAADRVTVYHSSTDLALAVSTWLFSGGQRLGNLSVKSIPEASRKKMAQLSNFALIDCRVSGFGSSHNYAFTHPAVLSDLILLLRDRLPPGAAHGRPLVAPFDGVWEIENDYLKPGSNPAG